MAQTTVNGLRRRNAIIVATLRAGVSVHAVALSHGVSESTVYAAASAAGLTLERRRGSYATLRTFAILRELQKEPARKQAAIALEFGVSDSHVSNIKRRAKEAGLFVAEPEREAS